MTLILFIAYCILSVLIHEAGHIVAAVIFGIQIKDIRLKLLGFAVVREHGPWFDGMLVALAGPFFNLAVAYILWGSIYEPFVLANLCVGVVNLLPIPHSDGSHALECLRHIENAKAERVSQTLFIDDVRVAELLEDLRRFPTQGFIVQAKTQAEAEKIYERVYAAGGDTSRLTISTYPERERTAA
jgi:membrane-associated protease RseP (regulator of RpoE activity)